MDARGQKCYWSLILEAIHSAEDKIKESEELAKDYKERCIDPETGELSTKCWEYTHYREYNDNAVGYNQAREALKATIPYFCD